MHSQNSNSLVAMIFDLARSHGDLRQTVGEVTGHVHHIEKRVTRLESRPDRAPSQLKDLLPLAWGLAIVLLVAFGKMTIEDAARLVAGSP